MIQLDWSCTIPAAVSRKQILYEKEKVHKNITESHITASKKTKRTKTQHFPSSNPNIFCILPPLDTTCMNKWNVTTCRPQQYYIILEARNYFSRELKYACIYHRASIPLQAKKRALLRSLAWIWHSKRRAKGKNFFRDLHWCVWVQDFWNKLLLEKGHSCSSWLSKLYENKQTISSFRYIDILNYP